METPLTMLLNIALHHLFIGLRANLITKTSKSVFWNVSDLNICRKERGHPHYSPRTHGKGQSAGTWRDPDSAGAKGI